MESRATTGGRAPAAGSDFTVAFVDTTGAPTGGTRSRQFALDRLALLLTHASINAEFSPTTPWTDVDVARPSWRPAGGTSDPADAPAAFAAAVERCVGDAASVAVLTSGGLDSAAVLHHADRLCRATGRPLTIVTVDLVADAGVRSVEAAKRVAEALGVRADVVVVDPLDAIDRPPPWVDLGPFIGGAFGILPSALGELERRGIDVLLTGDGSDELLGTPRYVARHVGARSAKRYWLDTWHGSRLGVALEVLGLAASALPRRASGLLYLAANWPELAAPGDGSPAAEPYRSVARAWERRWVDALVDQAGNGADWATHDAWDAVFPLDGDEWLRGQEPPRVARPFLTPPFLDLAYGLDPGLRFDAALPSAYQRRKGVVLRLLPPSAGAVFPPVKDSYFNALVGVAPDLTGDLRCVELGLVDAGRLRGAAGAVRARVAVVETWITQAEARGATAVTGTAGVDRLWEASNR